MADITLKYCDQVYLFFVRPVVSNWCYCITGKISLYYMKHRNVALYFYV